MQRIPVWYEQNKEAAAVSLKRGSRQIWPARLGAFRLVCQQYCTAKSLLFTSMSAHSESLPGVYKWGNKMSARKEWANVANQRAALLGLQLQFELAGQRISDACAVSNVPTLARAVELCLQDGVLQRQLAQARDEQQRAQKLADLLASSLSTQTPKQAQVHVLGKQRSRPHAAAMLEHVQVRAGFSMIVVLHARP